jgi:predicted nucleotidyltransferase
MPTSHELLHSRCAALVNVLSTLAQVRAILCFGSYAMGTSDASSDIDLYVICHPQIIAPDERQAAFLLAGDMTELNLDYDQPDWENQWCPSNDRLRLNGIQFDIVYNTLYWVQLVVSQVKTLGVTSMPELKFRPYTFLGMLENSVILYDADGVLHRIVTDLYPYPPILRQVLMTSSLAVIDGSLDDMQNYARRNIGNSAFLFHLWRVIDAMEILLFALNERYSPATKRLEEAYRSLPILPANFLERYNVLLETPLTPPGRLKIVAGLQALVDDIVELARRPASDP